MGESTTHKSTFTNIVLAMDLSLSASGFAVMAFESNGEPIILESALVTTKGKTHGERLVEIGDRVSELLSLYKPAHLVREKSFSRFAAATQAIYKVNGVVDYLLEDTHEANGTPNVIDEIAATSVKKVVTGNGRSSKEEVAEDVFRIMRIDNTDEYYRVNRKKERILLDDMTDAIAVGLAYYVEKGLINEWDKKQNTKQDTKKKK